MVSKIMSVIVAVILFLTSLVSGIQGKFRKSDIVILYTGDVHCGVSENIGYAGLKAYKNQVEKETKNVTLVDTGDFIQGGYIGMISGGGYIVDIMNYVGYDYAVPGNHEFDYGMQQLSDDIAASDFEYLSCDITYSGDGENLLKNVADYAIEDYGDVQVAFIGVTTPQSITSSTPAVFQDENGNYIYGFEDALAQCVQQCVVKARLQGADYVVALTHLGDNESHTPYSSTELIQGTTGIDAVLDGHDHSVIESRKVNNKDGDEVILSSTGTKLANIGRLTITKDGVISAELISDYTEKDTGTSDYIAGIVEEATAGMSVVFGKSLVNLSLYDENGVRMTRSRETAIGNLSADAYRTMLGADIGVVNGGGLRDSIEAGDLTYSDIFDVNPFGNHGCVIEATGQQIADALEWACRYTKSEYSDGTNAVGENGGFLQVSGLKYTIDTSVQTPVVSTDDGMLASIQGERRVRDIMVLQNGSYVPIDMTRTYTIAGSDYVLLNNGDGQTAFNGCKVVNNDGLLDYELLVNYIKEVLGCTITSENTGIDGRITVK